MEPVATSTVTLDEEFVEVALMFARHVEEDGYHADGLFDSVTADMIQMLHLEKQRGYPRLLCSKAEGLRYNLSRFKIDRRKLTIYILLTDILNQAVLYQTIYSHADCPIRT